MSVATQLPQRRREREWTRGCRRWRAKPAVGALRGRVLIVCELPAPATTHSSELRLLGIAHALAMRGAVLASPAETGCRIPRGPTLSASCGKGVSGTYKTTPRTRSTCNTRRHSPVRVANNKARLWCPKPLDTLVIEV